jgi:hypothetical protein
MMDKKSPMLGMTLLGQSAIRDTSTVDSLSENEGDGPECDDDGNPSTPSHNAVTVGVSGIAQQSLKDELAGDVGI